MTNTIPFALLPTDEQRKLDPSYHPTLPTEQEAGDMLDRGEITIDQFDDIADANVVIVPCQCLMFSTAYHPKGHAL